MKKIVLAALVVASLFASCSSEKTFKKKDGSTITAKPYGWASKENKVEGVNYELYDQGFRNAIDFMLWNPSERSCSNCQYQNSRELCGEEYCGQKYWRPKLEE